MKRISIPLVGALIVLACAIAALLPSDRTALARDITAVCQGADTDPAACYEEQIVALYPELSVSEVFNLIREVRVADPSYQFCHVLAHKLGERIVAEDPTAWVEAIPLNPPDGLCSNGFIHGVVGGRFRAEVLDDATLQGLTPDFRRACEPRDDWSPSDLDRAICYHGLGHLYDFITDADIPKALEICDATVPANMLRMCIEGVFMQIYQPLEPDDFLMIERMEIKPSTTTVRSYCARFQKDAHEGACLRESWPYFREAIVSGGAGAFCAGQPNDAETANCFQSASSIVGRMSLGDPEKAAAACNAFPERYQIECFSSSAQAVLEETRADGAKAIALCELAPDGMDEACTRTLAERARFIYGDHASEQRTDFCRLFSPENVKICNR